MDDRTKKLLERVVKLGTQTSWLNGRCELGKDGYEELRGVVKEAMECLRPASPSAIVTAIDEEQGVITLSSPSYILAKRIMRMDPNGTVSSPAYAVGPNRWRIPTGIHGPVAVVATPQEYDTMDTSVTISIYALGPYTSSESSES